MLEMVIEPLPRGLPSFVAQSAQQTPLRLKLRRRIKLRHETVAADPVRKPPIRLTHLYQTISVSDHFMRLASAGCFVSFRYLFLVPAEFLAPAEFA